MIAISDRPLDIFALTNAAARSDGAVASFVGVVRDHSGAVKVKSLLYEAYVPMALKCFEQIVAETHQRWTISNISIAHRTGLLQVGEAAVVVAVFSEHRQAALSACAYAIDRLKAIAPIWKKEFTEEGKSYWSKNCTPPH